MAQQKLTTLVVAVSCLVRLSSSSEAHGGDDGTKAGRKEMQRRKDALPSMDPTAPWAGYYAGVEGQAHREWTHILWPRIQNATMRSVLEISPGGGRWAELFRHKAKSYIGVDINAPAIESLRTSSHTPHEPDVARHVSPLGRRRHGRTKRNPMQHFTGTH